MNDHTNLVATTEPTLFDEYPNWLNTAQTGTERPVAGETTRQGLLTPPQASKPAQAVTEPQAGVVAGTASSRAAAQWNNHHGQTTILDFLTDDDRTELIALEVADTKTVLTDADQNRHWMERGNCVIPTDVDKNQQKRMAAEVDAALWPEPDQFDHTDWTAGRELCKGCPVIQQCLKYAVASGSTEGMFGGLTPQEREGWAKHNIAKQVTIHGTRSRYNAGCRCAECAEANRIYKARNDLDFKARNSVA